MMWVQGDEGGRMAEVDGQGDPGGGGQGGSRGGGVARRVASSSSCTIHTGVPSRSEMRLTRRTIRSRGIELGSCSMVM
jgi:hypothetical protein